MDTPTRKDMIDLATNDKELSVKENTPHIRKKRGELDDAYVLYRTSTDWTAADCYRQACVENDYPVPSDTVCYASSHRLDKRLLTRIQKELEESRTLDTLAARSVGLKLLKEAQSESVQATMVKHMTAQHYNPDQEVKPIEIEVRRDGVSISTRGQTVTVDASVIDGKPVASE